MPPSFLLPSASYVPNSVPSFLIDSFVPWSLRPRLLVLPLLWELIMLMCYSHKETFGDMPHFSSLNSLVNLNFQKVFLTVQENMKFNQRTGENYNE